MTDMYSVKKKKREKKGKKKGEKREKKGEKKGGGKGSTLKPSTSDRIVTNPFTHDDATTHATMTSLLLLPPLL